MIVFVRYNSSVIIRSNNGRTIRTKRGVFRDTVVNTCSLQPTIFKEMDGKHGLREETAFIGLTICNVAVIMAGFFTASLTNRLGTV